MHLFNVLTGKPRMWRGMAEPGNTTPLPGIMPGVLPETALRQEDFNPIASAKDLLRATRAGPLATIARNTGHPFSSLVTVPTAADASPLILLSHLPTQPPICGPVPRAA